MTMNKVSWNCMKISSCYGTKTTMPESENQGFKQSSLRRLSLSDFNNPTSPFSVEDISNSFIGEKLHIFTYAELRDVTQHFSRSNLLGEGGFGPVYKGFIDDKLRTGLQAQPVAVKSLDLDGLQGHREWMAEIIFLGQLQHPHLVKLIGYCCEDDQRLLVYEYMPRGSLENQLFRRYCPVLPWSTRMKIALGAAKGLAFLHETDKPVIYRDFKSSNILLDSAYTARLSDFGLAKDGPEGDETHITTRVMGTQGYAAPEYIMTGRLTTMSDVYSFGVVLLELLTGKRSMEGNCPLGRAQSLVEWARPMLKDSTKLERIIDVKLEGQYSNKEVRQASALAYKCLSHHPKARPAMSCVVKILELLQGFDDTFTAPFVYVVPNENVGRNCCRRNDGEKSVERNGENRQRRGWRHRITLPIVDQSDFSLYQNLENALNSSSNLKKGEKSATKKVQSPFGEHLKHCFNFCRRCRIVHNSSNSQGIE